MGKTVGIITFHWATNHGAVLQAYASQKYLEMNDLVDEVRIIDYKPTKYDYNYKYFIASSFKTIIERLRTLLKERKIAVFRDNYLNCTDHYSSEEQLCERPPIFDVYLAGSDQIWNPYFTLNGEDKPTGSYYLSFVPGDAVKASLSASFGFESLPKQASLFAKVHLDKFDYLSVRDVASLSILKNMSLFNANLTADPVSLLNADDYRLLYGNVSIDMGPVSCILRNHSKTMSKQIRDIKTHFGIESTNNIAYSSVAKWLQYIDNAPFVLTNSYHCVLFCPMFHTPFLVILEEGQLSGMNNRITTLLDYFNLQDRALAFCSDANSIEYKEINWDKIDLLMQSYRTTLIDYLDMILME